MHTDRFAGAAAGLVLDRILGEPPNRVHPVALFGRLMETLEDRCWRDSRLRGTAYAATGIAIGATVGAAIRSTAAATCLVTGARALWHAAAAVQTALEAGELDQARSRLPALVGRDPTNLDEKEVSRAAIESVAENTVDAIVAPALWAAAAGAPAALGYRAVNTLDAMVGHRSPRYQRFGWASARLDDAANYIPARVTAVLVAAVRPAAGRQIWVVIREGAPKHPSPNAGVAEAAFAAALGVRLGGTNVYGDRTEHRPQLGDGPPPLPTDIGRAVRLSSDVAWALTAALATAALATAGLSGRRPRGWGRG